MYSLHDMPDNAGLSDEAFGELMMPPTIAASSASLVPYGLYLIDDGQTQFLWVGREAVPQLVEDVFGVPDRLQLKVGKQTLPVLENDFNERVRAVIEKARDHRSRGVGSIVVPHLYVVREDGEPGLRLWAQTMLVEDRADQGVSLKQWLGMIREKVLHSSRKDTTSRHISLTGDAGRSVDVRIYAEASGMLVSGFVGRRLYVEGARAALCWLLCLCHFYRIWWHLRLRPQGEKWEERVSQERPKQSLSCS